MAGGGVRPVEVPYELLLASGEDGSQEACARVDALIEEVRWRRRRDWGGHR